MNNRYVGDAPAKAHISPSMIQRCWVDKVNFDYTAKRWKRGQYELPCYAGNFVILTPKDILTKDEAWINRSDLLNQFREVCNALPDKQLRALVDDYFFHRLSEDAKEKEIRAAAAATLSHFPQLLDYYIKRKEDNGGEAHKVSSVKVRETEIQFVEQIKALVSSHLYRLCMKIFPCKTRLYYNS